MAKRVRHCHDTCLDGVGALLPACYRCSVASYLSIVFHDQYGLTKVHSGDLTTIVVLFGSFLRPVGGGSPTVGVATGCCCPCSLGFRSAWLEWRRCPASTS